MNKKKIYKILSIIIGINILIAIVLTCYFTGTAVFNGSMQMVTNEGTSIEKSKEFLREEGFDLKGFKSKFRVETVEIESSLDGHKIPADYITIDGNKDADTVVLVHGMGANRLNVYPIAKMFLDNGYNVIAYDQRSSGENIAKYTTYGYLESKDLGDYVTYLKDNIGENKKIGVWGNSFGGATVGIFLGANEANENVDFAILDCPISKMSYMLSNEMSKVKSPLNVDFMMLMGNITTKIKLGFTYEDADVINYTNKTKVPLLIINSKADEVTPYFMGKDIHDSVKNDNKKIFTVDDSKHSRIFYDHNEEYKKSIFEFIDNLK